MFLPQLIVMILWWMAVSTWFGGVLFIAVAAPIIFRTVRESDPLIPTVLSVNLEGQHGTLLAGTIVANLLSTLVKVELACAAVMAICLVAQWLMFDPAQYFVEHLIRSALFLAAVGLVLYDWLRIGPRIVQARTEYLDHADEPEIANPAKERFDALHRESVTVLMVTLLCVMGMILFSARLSPGRGTLLVPPQSAPQAQ